MDTNVNVNDPRQHINEEPRNDFIDVAVGFAGMFGFMLVVAIIATVVAYFVK
jgi:hypothetical protein